MPGTSLLFYEARYLLLFYEARYLLPYAGSLLPYVGSLLPHVGSVSSCSFGLFLRSSSGPERRKEHLLTVLRDREKRHNEAMTPPGYMGGWAISRQVLSRGYTVGVQSRTAHRLGMYPSRYTTRHRVYVQVSRPSCWVFGTLFRFWQFSPEEQKPQKKLKTPKRANYSGE